MILDPKETTAQIFYITDDETLLAFVPLTFPRAALVAFGNDQDDTIFSIVSDIYTRAGLVAYSLEIAFDGTQETGFEEDDEAEIAELDDASDFARSKIRPLITFLRQHNQPFDLCLAETRDEIH